MSSWLWWAVAFTILIYIIEVTKEKERRRREALHAPAPHLPPGPRPLPLIGNLHQLDIATPHRSLAHLATTHGAPLMHLRLGSTPALVVSSTALAQQFLLNSAADKHFACRPKFEFCRRLLYGNHNGLAFAAYGPSWRTMRKFCTLELFTPKRMHDFRHLREEEMHLLIQQLSRDDVQNVNVASLARVLISNTMGRLVLTQRMSDVTVNGETLMDMFQQTTRAITPTLGDFIPDLGWFLDLRSRRIMDHAHTRMDRFWECIIHKREKDRILHPRSTGPLDFLDVLLSNPEIQKLGRDNLKATLMDILGAGTETSAITIEWAMAELLHAPETLKKLQKELEEALPKKEGRKPVLVREADIAGLRYLKAVVRETLRLHPPVPLLIPRALAGDGGCSIAGYNFAPRTLLFVNAWSMGRDPSVWARPEAFWPDRFGSPLPLEHLDSLMDLRAPHGPLRIIPFGYGRRSCPGMSLALSLIELALANLVWNFHWALPLGVYPTHIDMSEKSSSSTTHKAQPLLALITPR